MTPRSGSRIPRIREPATTRRRILTARWNGRTLGGVGVLEDPWVIPGNNAYLTSFRRCLRLRHQMPLQLNQRLLAKEPRWREVWAASQQLHHDRGDVVQLRQVEEANGDTSPTLCWWCRLYRAAKNKKYLRTSIRTVIGCVTVLLVAWAANSTVALPFCMAGV